jgi:hypothetical protein
MKELWYISSERSGARLMLFDGGVNGDEAPSGVPGRVHRAGSLPDCRPGAHRACRAASRAGDPRPVGHGLVLLNGGRQRDENPGGGIDADPIGGGPEGAA